MPSDDHRVTGHSLWREEIGGKPVELFSTTEIEISGNTSRWAVGSPTDPSHKQLVDSASREVREFLSGVLSEMHRMARRATVRPAPKPKPRPTRRLPANAPIPCPLCGGEAWVDCQVCDGEGFISQNRHEEWVAKNR